MKNATERHHWIALSHFPQVGARRFQYLWDAFGSIAAVWHASPLELSGVHGFSSAQAQTLYDFCQRTDPEAVSHKVEKAQIGVITRLDPDYPTLLASLYDPPPVLYWLGQAEVLQQLKRSVALVGTRDATAYGRQVAYQLGQELAQAGVMVVSGMAYGIDSAAHRGALSAGVGHTLAVLGSGVDVITPPRNHSLYAQLKTEGLLVSEFPPGFPATTWSFPVRNRIVSGLSHAVVVVEAGRKSGTLITVDCANEQGREVMAVPGPITTDKNLGAHRLLQQGAGLITGSADIFTAMGWALPSGDIQPPEIEPVNLTKEEKEVYVLLSETACHLEELMLRLPHQEPAQIVGTLMLLELKGLVAPLPGKHYMKKKH